jgi:hypothetical protein
MSPQNRTNPDTTDTAGHFGWDVLAGFYRVRASRPGCTSPTDPATPHVDSAVLTIPPPVTDLDLRLRCADLAGLLAATTDACQRGQITSPAVCAALTATLRLAQTLAAAGQRAGARLLVSAYIVILDLERGRSVTPPAYDRLRPDAAAVLTSLA